MNLTYNNGTPLIGRQLDLFLNYIRFYHLEDKYVFLKEDEKGRYIEYIFKEGVPEYNRCLSWYDKPHPKYIERHPDTIIKIHNVSDTEIYYLGSYTCGQENKPNEERCSIGNPSILCHPLHCKEWTIDEPIKCACWVLSIVKDVNFYVKLSDLDSFNLLLNQMNKYIKLEWPDSQEFIGKEGCYTMNDEVYTTFVPENLIK